MVFSTVPYIKQSIQYRKTDNSEILSHTKYPKQKLDKMKKLVQTLRKEDKTVVNMEKTEKSI